MQEVPPEAAWLPTDLATRRPLVFGVPAVVPSGPYARRDAQLTERMGHHLARRSPCLVTLLLAATLAGCADSVEPPPPPPKLTPETELTYAPLPGDTTAFRVRFFWNGYDKDGEVVRFR